MANAYFKLIPIIIDTKYQGKLLNRTILKELKRGTLLVFRKDVLTYYKLYNYTDGSETFGLLPLNSPYSDSIWDSVCWADLYRVGTSEDLLTFKIKEVL